MVRNAQHELHCSRFFTSVTAPFTVQPTTSTTDLPTYSRVPKCFKPLNSLLGLYQQRQDTLLGAFCSHPVANIISFGNDTVKTSYMVPSAPLKHVKAHGTWEPQQSDS